MDLAGVPKTIDRCISSLSSLYRVQAWAADEADARSPRTGPARPTSGHAPPPRPDRNPLETQHLAHGPRRAQSTRRPLCGMNRI